MAYLHNLLRKKIWPKAIRKGIRPMHSAVALRKGSRTIHSADAFAKGFWFRFGHSVLLWLREISVLVKVMRNGIKKNTYVKRYWL